MKRQRVTEEGERKLRWRTNDTLWKRLDLRFGFVLDAAAEPCNAKCQRFLTKKDDALGEEAWPLEAGEYAWVNHPFGVVRSRLWMARIRKVVSEQGVGVVAIVPATTSVKWFHDCLPSLDEIWHSRGRIPYGDPDTGTVMERVNFASQILVWHPESQPELVIGQIDRWGYPTWSSDQGRTAEGWRAVLARSGDSGEVPGGRVD